MAKRRLTQQQKRRQTALQQKRRQVATTPCEQREQLAPSQTGLVISHHGKHFIVQSQDNECFHCEKRQNLGAIVTGDQVVWHEIAPNKGVVTAALPRDSLIERRVGHTCKTLAANVTQLVIVCAITPAPQECTLDRYLVLAKHLSLNPIIVFNKWDLFSDSDTWFMQHLQTYKDIGLQVLTLSPGDIAHLNTLQTWLSGHTSILVGQSGVGKSTIINQLLPDAQAATGAISEEKGLGKHTTTVTKLYHLPNGGRLIDSPGIRQFQFYAIEPEKLFSYFDEFIPYAQTCRFKNCRHDNEPGCAILEAVTQGGITPFRLNSFKTILNECEQAQSY